MEQHPIPQNISSYQFRLVGDMTLKQFFQLAGGIVVGLIFYSSPLLGIIKWPFAIVSVVLGVALAFLPFEERPLERWILAFFKAIYSPTLFHWQKGGKSLQFFQDESSASPQVSQQQEAVLQSYLGPKQKEGPLQTLEAAEKNFLSALGNLFVQQTTPAQTTVKQELKFPEAQPVKITGEGTPKIVVEERKFETPINTTVTASAVAPTIVGEEMVSSHQAQFSVDAAPPNPPSTPNVVVGQVVDQDRKIVEGAIMEIKDANGRPIRALRSNKVGHFIIVTPLDSGKYDIVTDKDGYEFSPVSFEAVGVIIPPILVKGRRLYDQNSVPVNA